MAFAVRVARGEFEVVDTDVAQVLCTLRVSAAPGIAGTPTHTLLLSPDARWLAIGVWWELAGLAFVLPTTARRVIVDEPLATVDRSCDGPLQWTGDARLRVWTRREDTDAPCWFTFDPQRACWTGLGESDAATPAAIALASAHRAPLDRRASLLESAPIEVRDDVRRVLDRRAAKALFYTADPRGAPERARAIYAEVIERIADWAEPRRALAASLDRSREWEAMREACAAWRAAIPGDPMAIAEQAAASLRLGEIDECARLLAALERAHGDPRAWMDNEAFDRCADVAALARWS